MKIVINKCFGGFGLSDAAYEQLAGWGIPIRRYDDKAADATAAEVIFDREMTPPEADSLSALYHKYKPHGVGGRYWDTWTSGSRNHPLVVRVVEELGEATSGPYAKLKIVEIPDGIEWSIDEYDGMEHIAEIHRTWG